MSQNPMLSFLEQLNDLQLNRLVRTVSPGEVLFNQGEWGNTMYVVTQGTVMLLHKTMNVERLVGTVGPGEVVGEKAILGEAPYRRTFTARIKTEAVLIELDARSLRAITMKVPDFSMKIVRIVTERLDQANQLISLLLLPNAIERFVQYLLWFAQHHHKKVAQGLEITMTMDELHQATNVDPTTIHHCIADLCAQKILLPRGDGFVLSDETALITFMPILKERNAA